jgi:hypothetical protein
MKKTTLAALAMSLGAATSAHAEKPTDPQTELIVNLAVITASVDRCHFEIDSRIIALDLFKELMLIEDAPPGARYHYNVASALTTGANAVQGAYWRTRSGRIWRSSGSWSRKVSGMCTH